jgi:hypothetical protein
VGRGQIDIATDVELGWNRMELRASSPVLE